MATISINCPIDMSFDLDEALTLPQDPSHRIASSNTLVVEMPTVDAVAIDGCSVCMESFGPGEGGKQLPCGHVYHQACITDWSLQHNSCPLCRCKIF